MARVTHARPAKDARAIFTAAEDFRLAYIALIKSADETGLYKHNYRTIGPQYACAAFSVELYLKCIIVDAGVQNVPGTHNLSLLFANIPKQTRRDVLKCWREILQQWKAHDPARADPSGLETILSNVAEAFDRWRYRFEFTASELTVDDFTHVHLALSEFLYTRHPDWRADGNQYFWATFPAPKKP